MGYSGTRDAEWALEWAARIAEPIGARLHLVQAVPFPSVPADLSPAAIANIVRASVERSREDTRLAASRVAARGLQVTSSARQWLTADSIVDTAAELRAGLIVVGQRRGGLTRWIGGSVSSQVVRLARDDVMVAMGPPPKDTPLKVLVGIDGSLNSVRALRSARRIFPGAEISALFAVRTTDVPSARGILANAEAAAGLRAKEIATIVRRGHPVREIVTEIREGGHHVLVVGRRGLGPFEELLTGSTCDKLLHLSPVSMLVVK